MKNQTIVILGGGISGLVTAYELSKKGCSVLVLEKEKHQKIWEE